MDVIMNSAPRARASPRGLASLPRGRALERLICAVAAEAATPRDLVRDSRRAAVSPRVARQRALHDMLACVEHLAGGRGIAFKADGSGLRVADLGRRFVDALLNVGLQPLLGYAPLRQDPRIKEILDQVETIPALIDFDDAAGTARALSALTAGLRERVRVAQAICQAVRHRTLDLDWFDRIRTYLSEIIRMDDRPRVLRLELRGVHQSTAVVYPRSAARLANDLAAAWFGKVQRVRRKDILGLAWRLQYDDEDGFHHHLLLVTRNSAQEEFAAFRSSLHEAWRAVAGDQAWVMDCNGEGIDFAYRGRAPHVGSDDDVVDELSAAAAYFALAGTMEEYDFQADPPVRGFKACPRVQKAKVCEVRI